MRPCSLPSFISWVRPRASIHTTQRCLRTVSRWLRVAEVARNCPGPEDNAPLDSRAQCLRGPPGDRGRRRVDPLPAALLADLNQIEQLFAKLKASLHTVAAHTKDELWQAIGLLLAAVPPSECANYLSHCGNGFI